MATTTATAKAIVKITTQEWILTLSLIFGGCCSNAFALEKLIQSQSKSGNLITLFQFIFVSIYGLWKHIEIQKHFPFVGLKKRNVPIKSWLAMVAMFWSVNIMNNWALGFQISMPFHIIFRSASIMVVLIGVAYIHSGSVS